MASNNSTNSGNSGFEDGIEIDIKRKHSFIANLLFETPGGTRFTQDSPILPTVWYAYALSPNNQQELILTVESESGTGKAAHELRTMLFNLRKKLPKIFDPDKKKRVDRKRARVSFIPGQIAVRLYFDELLRIVLPLTPWWQEMQGIINDLEQKYLKDERITKREPDPLSLFPHPIDSRKLVFADALMLMRREIDESLGSDGKGDSKSVSQWIRKIPAEFSWLVRIAGIIFEGFNCDRDLLSSGTVSRNLEKDFRFRDRDRYGSIETLRAHNEYVKKHAPDNKEAHETRSEISNLFFNIFENWSNKKDEFPSEKRIWRVTKNRVIHLAVAKSALTVKADAARRLFDVSCENITWAVIDSGIDGDHPAFKRTSKEHEAEILSSNGGKPVSIKELDNRITKTLDFTRLRSLLEFDIDSEIRNEATKKLIKRLARQIIPPKDSTKTSTQIAAALVKNLHERIENGYDINWQDLKHGIELSVPPTPVNDHGTHVAGILGADWVDEDGDQNLPLHLRTRRMQGVCPDINLIDVRVFHKTGVTDEFELLAALQYLRWMNERAGAMKVHGANMSLSLIHQVQRFACGQTPICDECNESSALGMVIVAAAGNRGFEMEDMNRVQASDGFRSVSITDPGNAASVITVGATHRKRPHEYGVSYFSSRGPTGDGRLKPDLVAPGEKIKGPTPGGSEEFKDGTSMAAPHVSGAAALLMARHTELIAKPDRIKRILCETATDLGRERYFQGHGVVDILRAMQSV